jgi:hypothetical protein
LHAARLLRRGLVAETLSQMTLIVGRKVRRNTPALRRWPHELPNSSPSAPPFASFVSSTA